MPKVISNYQNNLNEDENKTLQDSIDTTNSSGLVTDCYNGTDFQVINGQDCDLTYVNVTCGDLKSFGIKG